MTEKTHLMHCAHCDTDFYTQEHVLDEQNLCSVCGELILLGPSGPDDPGTAAPDDPDPVPDNPAPEIVIEPDDDDPGGDEPGDDDPGNNQPGNNQSGGSQSGGSKASGSPRTGDDSGAELWITVLTACCFGICGAVFVIAKNRKKIRVK